VLFQKHLKRGVSKGILTQEAADAKYQQWLEGKQSKIEEKRKRVMTSAQKEIEARLAEETKIKEAIAEKVRIKNIPPPVEEVPASTEAEASAPDIPSAEGNAETPATE
jgi:small subunit ribosomal protein S16